MQSYAHSCEPDTASLNDITIRPIAGALTWLSPTTNNVLV